MTTPDLKRHAKVLLSDLRGFAQGHKAIAALIGVALVSALYGSFHTTNASTENRYVLGAVKKGTVTASVSGTGTVSATDQIDVKSKASGDVLSVSVKAGDTVYKGQLLATLDARDAYNALRSAEIAYEKLTEAADASAVSSAQSSLVSAETAETKAYNDSQDDVSSAFIDLPTTLDGLDSMYNSSSGYLADLNTRYVSDTAYAYRSVGAADLFRTEAEYADLTKEYGSLTRASATSTVQSVLTHAYAVTKDLAQTLKETKTAVDYVKANTPAVFAAAGTAAQSDVASWTDKNSAHLSALLADQGALSTSHLGVIDKQAALDKVNSGADALDVESASLSLQEKRDAYNDAFVRAPFSGVVGKVDVKTGDSAAPGTSVATLITNDDIAVVSLNEVDAAKVKEGDKATLTFDAVDGLSIDGTVSEIDLVGTVTQGVVNYAAKISFDAQDPRVRPGMSVSAEIVTGSKTDVLAVPSSAVKSMKGSSFVSVFDPPLALLPGSQGVTSSVPPKLVRVETGLSGDTSTEILSGLSEGQQIVVRTLAAGAATAPAAQASIFGGSGRTTGGSARALGR